MSWSGLARLHGNTRGGWHTPFTESPPHTCRRSHLSFLNTHSVPPREVLSCSPTFPLRKLRFG